MSDCKGSCREHPKPGPDLLKTKHNVQWVLASIRQSVCVGTVSNGELMNVPRVGPVVRCLAILEPRYQVQYRSLDAEPHGVDYCCAD